MAPCSSGTNIVERIVPLLLKNATKRNSSPFVDLRNNLELTRSQFGTQALGCVVMVQKPKAKVRLISGWRILHTHAFSYTTCFGCENLLLLVHLYFGHTVVFDFFLAFFSADLPSFLPVSESVSMSMVRLVIDSFVGFSVVDPFIWSFTSFFNLSSASACRC